MKTCARCGGGVAEPNEVTGWAGKWCHCGWANDRFTVPFKPLPEDMSKIETPTEYVRQLMRENAKNNVQKPSMSHIINLIEQLTLEEAEALSNMIEVIIKGKQ